MTIDIFKKLTFKLQCEWYEGMMHLTFENFLSTLRLNI